MAEVFSEQSVPPAPETVTPPDPKKEKLKRDWTRAKESGHPNLPEKPYPYQVDVLSSLCDHQDKTHVFAGMPTGWGKSKCILGCALFLPEGSMTLVIPALTTIQNQLEVEALDLGLSVVNINKTPVSELKPALEARPQIVLANVDTIANRVVQEIIGSVRFGVGRRRPIVAVDELQVVDPVAGWTFREYGPATWEFVLATFRPRFLLCSATMSEASLSRAVGNMGLSRKSVKTFFKPPLKVNTFQEVLTIKRLSFRYNSKTIGLGG